jgi:hypothetical protein
MGVENFKFGKRDSEELWVAAVRNGRWPMAEQVEDSRRRTGTKEGEAKWLKYFRRR